MIPLFLSLLVFVVLFLISPFDTKFWIFAFFGYGEMIELTEFDGSYRITWRRKGSKKGYVFPATDIGKIIYKDDGTTSYPSYVKKWEVYRIQTFKDIFKRYFAPLTELPKKFWAWYTK